HTNTHTHTHTPRPCPGRAISWAPGRCTQTLPSEARRAVAPSPPPPRPPPPPPPRGSGWPWPGVVVVHQCPLRARFLAETPGRSFALTARWRGETASAAKSSLAAQKVVELIELRRVQMFRSFLRPMCGLCFCLASGALVMIIRGGSRWGSQATDLAFFCLYIGLIALSCKSHWLHVRSLNFWTSAMMCCLLVAVSPLAIEFTTLPIVFVYTLGLRLILSLCMRPPLFLLWKAVYLMVVSVHFIPYVTAPHEGEGKFTNWTHHTIIPSEVIACIAEVSFSFAAHTVMKAEAWQTVQARTSHSGLEAARSLLGTICDAVVELDADLRLTVHCPGLATMLLRSPHLSLTGTTLDKYMASEDDRERFNSHLQVPVHETGAIADAFHLNLRDSCGSAISAELFHVCFRDCLTGLPQHLVGLREHSDLAEPPAAPQPGVSRQACSLDASARRQPPELTVVFDAVTFGILRTSPAFDACFGPCPPGSAVSEWLTPQDCGAFCDRVNGFCSSGTPSCTFDWVPSGLRLPHAKDIVVPHCLKCTLVADSRGDEEAVVACIVLAMCYDDECSNSSESSSTQRMRAIVEPPLAGQRQIGSQLSYVDDQFLPSQPASAALHALGECVIASPKPSHSTIL
ncbi:unnamed protein product, partial [Prorocentrum cordatum]